MNPRQATSSSKIPRGLAFVVLSVLLVSGLGASGIADQANDLVGDLLELANLVPNSGNDTVDRLKDELREDFKRLGEEPQVPANYFYSSAGQDLRVGGFGAWRNLSGTKTFTTPPPASTDWQENNLHPSVGSWGFSFGNEPTGRYRAGVYDAYLVSPLIDLRSVTFTTNQGGVQSVEPIGGATATIPPVSIPGVRPTVVTANVTGMVTLRLDHKFQLGQFNDGGRVEVFRKAHEPRLGSPTAPDAIVLPNPMVGDKGASLTPDAQNYRPTTAFGTQDNDAFTGRQADWTPAEFNLTSFVGEEIYIAFHVRVNVPGFLAPTYFDDPTGERFPPPRANFYGWKIDAVQIEGVSHLTNLRVRTLATPSFRDSANGPILVPTGAGPIRGNHTHFEAVVENRGAVTEENVSVRFSMDQVLPNGATEPRPCQGDGPAGDSGVVVVPFLRPGDNTLAAINCQPFLDEGLRYRLTVTVDGSSSREDGDPGDNVFQEDLQARTVARLTNLAQLGINPAIGETDQVRSLRFEAQNEGNDDLLLAMSIEGPSSMQVGPPGEGPRTALTPLESVVRDEWELLFPLPGDFQVRLVVRNAIDGSIVLAVPFHVTSALSPGALFFDDYSGDAPIGQIVGTSQWTNQSLWPPPPPEPDWDETYWDLAVNRPEKGTPPGVELSVLWGRRLDPGSLASPQLFSRLEIRVVHYLDTRRLPDTNGDFGVEQSVFRVGLVPQEAAGPYSGELPFFSTGASPGLLAGLARLPAGPDQAIDQYSIQPGLILLQSIHPAKGNLDRQRFYRVQWVDEVYQVLPEDFAEGLTSISESLLGAYRLGIAATVPRGVRTTPGAECRSPAPRDTTKSPEQNQVDGLATVDQCPTWWVDRVTVTAYPVATSEAPIHYLATTGDPADQRLESAEIQRLALGGSPRFGSDVGYWSSESYAYEHYLGARPYGPGSPTGSQTTPGRCTLKVRDNVNAEAPAESPQNEENIAEGEDIAHGCVMWERHKGLPVYSPTNAWQVTSRISTGEAAVWWMGNPTTLRPGSIQHTYATGPQANALFTPTINFAPGLQNPRLQFEQKYRFHRPVQNGVGDYGAVYAQFMALAPDGSPEPDSPWYQLVTRPPPPIPQSYEENAFTFECGATPGCSDMREIASQSVVINLGPDLRFLDYLAVNQSSARDFEYSPPLSGTTLRGFDAGRLDLLAYQLGSRSILEGALLRFAFIQGGYAGNTVDYATVPDDGWAVGPILISGDNRLGRNLHLDSVRLDTTYDVAHGLGPSTSAEIRIGLRNLGLFTIRGVDVTVELEREPAGSSAIQEQTHVLEQVLLKTDEATEIAIPITVPAEEGQYTIRVRATPHGANDDDPLDNCATVDPQAPLGQFDCIAGLALNTVQVHRDASLFSSAGQPLARIVPAQGRVDNPAEKVFFPRSVFATLRNIGNVPIGGALNHVLLQQSVARIETGPSGETQLGIPRTMKWRLIDDLQPGDEVRFNAANFEFVSATPPGQPEYLINFDRAGRYLVRFEAILPDDQVRNNDDVDLIAEAWEVFYSNTFEEFGAAEERLEVVTGDFVPGGTPGDAWTITDQEGFRTPTAPGERSYWFGNAMTGIYASGANATLTLPAIDLTSASQAFINFRTKYDLENGYDGGRVEASTNGGETWVPLSPEPLPSFAGRAYPGNVISSNPLGSNQDSVGSIGAFTGASQGAVEGTEWVPVEVDLSKALPEFRKPLVVESFEQKGFPLEADRTLNHPRNRTNRAWVLAEGSCATFQCWRAENVAFDGPMPLPSQPEFWWSGNKVPGGTLLALRLNHSDVDAKAYGAGKQLEISWWQSAIDSAAPGFCVTFGTQSAFSSCSSPPQLREVQGSWRRYSHEFTLFERGLSTLNFTFQPNRDAFQRGVAVAGVSLTRFDAGPGGSRTNVEQKIIPIPGGTGVWNLLTQAPPCTSGCPDLGWRVTSILDPAPTGWRITDTRRNHDEVVQPVWVFHDATPSGTNHAMPLVADERLVTPLVDLSRVVGSANLSYWQQGVLPEGTRRIFEIQVQDRLASPPRWGPWTTLAEQTGPFTQRQWAQGDGLSLTPYIGQKVRFGFRIQTTSNQLLDADTGWFLDGIQVKGETMVAGPLLVRFHAGTDASIGEGGWGIDNLEIVGRRYSREAGNLAVVLDDPRPDRDIEPGTRVTFNGTLRNLSPRTWIGQGVMGEVLVGDTVDPMEAAPPSPLDTPGLVGPSLLLPAGSKDVAGRPLDRSRFSFSFDFPPNLAVFTVRIRAVDTLTNLPVRDENLGDHTSLIRLELKSQNQDPQILNARLSPADPDPGTPATLGFQLRNTATVDVDVLLTPRLRPLPSGAPILLEPRTMSVGAQSVSTEQTWSWVPQAPGTYAIEVEKQTTFLRSTGAQPAAPKTNFVRYAFVAERLVYAAEDFETIDEVADDGADPITTKWVRSVGPGTCAQAANPATLWTPTNEFSHRPPMALRSGVSDEAFLGRDERYPSNLDDELRQPLLDLSFLVDVGRTDFPGSLTVPNVFLNFWYKSFTEPNRDGLKVQARLLQENAFLPERWDLTAAGCTGPSVLGGLLDDWKLASLPLQGAMVQQQKPIQFLYRFVSDATNELQGVYLDSMTVSAYDASIEAAQDRFALLDNADKVFNIRVTNLAPVRDTFDLRIDPDSTTLASDIATVDIEPDVLTLGPGEAQSVKVHLRTQLSRNHAPTGPLNLGILGVSRGDPNRVALGQIGFTQFAPRNWPDLVAELSISGDPTTTEGESFTLLAQVSNFGLAPSPDTDYEVFACPAELSTSACQANPKTYRIGSGELPAILPFEQTRSEQLSRVLFPVTWRPKVGTNGDYRIVLLADPKEQIVDYDLSNNEARQSVSLKKLALPDLTVDLFELTNTNGEPVKSVFEGEVVRLRAVVRNAGDEPAPTVRISIANQFEIKRTELLSLEAGDSTEVRANWIATAGTAIIKVQATTTKPELDLENNVLAKKLVVKRRDISFTADVEALTGLPGDNWTMPLLLTNKGDASADVKLRVVAPSGLRATISPEDAVVEVLEQLTANLRITTDEAFPGAYLVRVEATVGTAADAPLTITIPVDLRGLAAPKAAPVAIATAKGEIQSVSLPVVNAGTELALLTPRVHAPAGWHVQPRVPIIQIEPGATQMVEFQVRIPPNFAPGEYVVRVEFDGNPAPSPSELLIEVPPMTKVGVEAVRDIASPGLREILVRIRSLGNTEATPDLVLASNQETLRISIDPPLKPLQPGQSSLHTVTISGPGPAPPSSDGVLVAGQPIGEASTTVELEPPNIDLAIAALQVAPGLRVKPGQSMVVETRVRNAGSVAVPETPVGLYANGRLVDYESVSVPPGQSKLVRFQLTAGTEPMVLFAAVDPYDALPESNRENNAALASVQMESKALSKASAPGFGAFLVLVAALWVAWGTRRE